MTVEELSPSWEPGIKNKRVFQIITTHKKRKKRRNMIDSEYHTMRSQRYRCNRVLLEKLGIASPLAQYRKGEGNCV